MHAPDGFYSNSLSIIMDLLCAGLFFYCLKKIWKRIHRKEVLLASSVGAFCFALQVANIEVSQGSSCHLMGGVLASIVLGPYLGSVVMTIIHLIQVFLFQDGGIMSLGPNLLTIVFVSTFGGYYVYSLLKDMVMKPFGFYISAFLSAWFTLLVTGLAVCGMLSASRVLNFSITCPLIGTHGMLGMAEGLLTVFIMAGINILAPNILDDKKATSEAVNKAAYALLGLALLIIPVFSLFASRSSHGLQKMVLEKQYVNSQKIIIPYKAPIPDYLIPGIENRNIAHVIGGTLGTVATFLFCLLVCSLIKGKMSFEKS